MLRDSRGGVRSFMALNGSVQLDCTVPPCSSAAVSVTLFYKALCELQGFEMMPEWNLIKTVAHFLDNDKNIIMKNEIKGEAL